MNSIVYDGLPQEELSSVVVQINRLMKDKDDFEAKHLLLLLLKSYHYKGFELAFNKIKYEVSKQSIKNDK